MGKRHTLRRLGTVRRAPVAGRCLCCGRRTAFVWLDPNPREGLVCIHCRSNARHRLVAKVLAERWGLSNLLHASAPVDVYCADRYGPVACLLKKSDRVAISDYLPKVAPGAPLEGGGTCQDLEDLTYRDAAFDVVITEDVLEHVRRPDAAFAEIRRVLRPGGAHIFTVPFRFDRPTLTRVDTSDAEDVHLMEPEWHGDSIRGRILAYRTFGYDMFGQLTKFGFDTRVRFAGFADRRYGIYDVSVFISNVAR